MPSAEARFNLDVIRAGKRDKVVERYIHRENSCREGDGQTVINIDRQK